MKKRKTKSSQKIIDEYKLFNDIRAILQTYDGNSLFENTMPVFFLIFLWAKQRFDFETRLFKYDEKSDFNYLLSLAQKEDENIVKEYKEVIERLKTKNVHFPIIFDFSIHLGNKTLKNLILYLEDTTDIFPKTVFKEDLFGQFYQISIPKDTQESFSAYYTPYHTAVFMARMIYGNEEKPAISDFCCGSGVMLLAHLNIDEKRTVFMYVMML